MKKYLSIVLSLVFALSAFAKRAPVPQVAPLIIGKLKFIAPNDNGLRGYVQAWDIETEKLLWEVTIYNIPTDGQPKDDLFWKFIKSIKADDKGKIIIIDELNKKYWLDPKTKKTGWVMIRKV